MVAQFFPFDGKLLIEFRRIGALHLEKDNFGSGRKAVDRSDEAADTDKILRSGGGGLSRDDADDLMAGALENTGGIFRKMNARNAQLRRARGSRDERNKKNGGDEKAGDLQTFRAFPDIHRRGVDEDQRHNKIRPSHPLSPHSISTAAFGLAPLGTVARLHLDASEDYPHEVRHPPPIIGSLA